MMIKEIADSQVFLLTLTVGVYIGAMWLRRKVNWALLHPIFVSIVVLIAFLRLSGIEYEHYMRQTQVIDFLLGLSVVALGYILHDQIYNIRGNVISIVVAILVGSAVGIVSVALIARWMGAEPAVVASLEPKSVTTAIALSVSANSGGIPALTSVAVIVVGVFGGIVGPWVLRRVGVESRIAKGLAMGAAAHALGTARALPAEPGMVGNGEPESDGEDELRRREHPPTAGRDDERKVRKNENDGKRYETGTVAAGASGGRIAGKSQRRPLAHVGMLRPDHSAPQGVVGVALRRTVRYTVR